MDFNPIVLIAVGVVGSGVLITLLRGWGQSDTRMEIDGRTFPFPQWVVSAITCLMDTEPEFGFSNWYTKCIKL